MGGFGVELSKVFRFIFMCDYTYFDTERNCLKSKLELMRYHLVVAFCIIILAVYSKVCTINFERPVNYLCDAWHVFPPKYEAWTHFNRPSTKYQCQGVV